MKQVIISLNPGEFLLRIEKETDGFYIYREGKRDKSKTASETAGSLIAIILNMFGQTGDRMDVTVSLHNDNTKFIITRNRRGYEVEYSEDGNDYISSGTWTEATGSLEGEILEFVKAL